MSQQSCFIAISTGQNIANVAPLLATATPDDHIIFIESAEAKQRCWTEPATTVLYRHGLKRVRIITLQSNDPGELYRAVYGIEWPPARKVLIGNGGTKPQSMALYETLRDSSPDILYSVDRPCILQWHEGGPTGPIRITPYEKTTLTLNDVLNLRGMNLHTPGQAIWEQGQLTQRGQEFYSIREGYGFDWQATFDLHDRHAYLASNRKMSCQSIPHLPRWPDIERIAPSATSKFIGAYSSCVQKAPQTISQQDRNQIKNLFNAAMNTLEMALQPYRPISDLPKLGETFEKAMTARLCHILQKPNTPTSFIQGIWNNVKVDSKQNPGVIIIEADILILMKNGVILAIEAKSHSADIKDLHARLLNLQRIGSKLARIIICSPIYTSASKKPWFYEHHNLYHTIQQHGLFHIAYTLPNQIEYYELYGKEEKPKRFFVQDFDQKVLQLLHEYSYK